MGNFRMRVIQQVPTLSGESLTPLMRLSEVAYDNGDISVYYCKEHRADRRRNTAY